MHILITGAQGRLGQQLMNLLAQGDHTISGIDIDTVDITDRAAVQQAFDTATPQLVIQYAALNAVDHCAEHPDAALETKALGTQHIAIACQQHDAALVYVSTNEVFAGRTYREHLEYDCTAPVNPYGYSKWVGEQIVRDLVRRHYIVRTSWLFAHGGRNFIQAILDRAQAGQPLRVVTNEVSSPTYNNDLAAAIIQLITMQQYGIYHLVNEGYASRYAFAREILDLAGYTDTAIEPIALTEYPRASRPPEYALLRNLAAARLGITLRPWQDALAAFLAAEGLLKATPTDV